MSDKPTNPRAKPPRRSKRPPSRPKRWADACADASTAVGDLEDALAADPFDLDAFESAKVAAQVAIEELVSIQEEYQEWRDNLPDGLDSSPVADKLDEVTGIDLGYASQCLDEEDPQELDIDSVRSAVDEAESADLPLGFGRD